MIDVERWQPDRWDQIVGNEELKEYFWDLIWCVRKERHRSGFNLLLTGPSRGGKTSGVTLGIKCLWCLNFDFQTMNPCGVCHNCKMKIDLFGTDGWESFMDYEPVGDDRRPVRFHYFPVDCTRISEADLESILFKVRVDDDFLKVIYLDEVHRLGRRFMDEKLLKPLEQSRAIWIASTAYLKKEEDEGAKKLDKMFQNRFTYRIDTRKAPIGEFTGWLAQRCHDWSLKCDDPKQVLTRLAERSNQSPGMALQVLNKAHKKRSKLLTMEMVEGHIFDVDD